MPPPHRRLLPPPPSAPTTTWSVAPTRGAGRRVVTRRRARALASPRPLQVRGTKLVASRGHTEPSNNSSSEAGVSSAPISISIVSNHGHVRTLAPNSFGKMAATTTTGETDTTGNRSLSSASSTTDQCSKYCQVLTSVSK